MEGLAGSRDWEVAFPDSILQGHSGSGGKGYPFTDLFAFRSSCLVCAIRLFDLKFRCGNHMTDEHVYTHTHTNIVEGSSFVFVFVFIIPEGASFLR